MVTLVILTILIHPAVLLAPSGAACDAVPSVATTCCGGQCCCVAQRGPCNCVREAPADTSRPAMPADGQLAKSSLLLVAPVPGAASIVGPCPVGTAMPATTFTRAQTHNQQQSLLCVWRT